VVFIRQVLQHLSNAHILRAIPKIAASYRFLVLTEHLPLGEAFTPNLDKPADCTVVLSKSDFEDLARGRLDPAMAMMRGRMKVAGDFTVADTLVMLHEVQEKADDAKRDKALQALRRALEDGFENIKEIYSTPEFAQLIKDERFTEMMKQRPTAIPMNTQ